jgi:conjugal transfer pilus assembly protein TraF
MTRLSLLLAAIVLSNSTFAEPTNKNGFYERRAEGWFWYEPEPMEEEKKEPKKKPESKEPAPMAATPKPEEGPRPFSTVWVREKLETLIETAIEDPSPTNIRAYLYMQKTAMDMSSKFSEEYQAQVMLDPNLDENTRRPISSFGGREMTMQANLNKQNVLEKVAQKMGLWFFYAANCSYCHKQAPLLENLNRLYGIQTLAIALDGLPLPGGEFKNYVPDRGHGAKYQITSTPTLMLVKKGEEPVKISEGILSQPELEQRILMAAKSLKWLDEEDYNSTLPYKKRDVVIPTSKEATNGMDLDDPDTLIAYIKDHIEGR